MLAREGDGAEAKYGNTPDTAAFLVPASPMYMGGILKMANNRLYRHWGNLTEALRTGQPQSEVKQTDGNDVFGALFDDPRRLAEFLEAMAGVQRGNFITIAEKFDSADLPKPVASAAPAAHCLSRSRAATLFAPQKITAAGLNDKITAMVGDFFYR